MAGCDSPCAPCCKYGGFIANEEDVQEPTVRPCGSRQETSEEAQMDQIPTKEVTVNEEIEMAQKQTIVPGEPACYLPQKEDIPGRQVSSGRTREMGPIGPWATGRVDWSPLADLTGTRPVVSKYSITRYSIGEWRRRNQEILNGAYAAQHATEIVSYTADQCLEKTRTETDKDQENSTRLVKERGGNIHRWKCELERAIDATIEELTLLSEQQLRLKQAGSILTIPESIAAECIDIRSSRLEPDLVRDDVEEEIVKELALTAEIRDLFNRTLVDIQHHIVQTRAARQRLELDWSDKKVAHDCENLNSLLNNQSTSIMLAPGSTRIPADQSSIEYWEHFTRESLYQSEQTRQNAVTFRGTLNAILNNAARDLRTQADKVDTAIAKRIECTEQLREKLESELKSVLASLVQVEKVVNRLQIAIRNMDFPLKVAQSRLDNKLHLPRVENCRDASTLAIVNEVKGITNRVAVLYAELKQAENCKSKLLDTRDTLEREIMIKLKNLWIDKDRIQYIRSFYPSSTALTGY